MLEIPSTAPHPSDAEAERLRRELDILRADLGRVERERQHWEDGWKALRADLGRYGDHDSDCPQSMRGVVVLGAPRFGRPCTCGFDRALTPSAVSAGEEWARMREIVKTAQWIAKRTPRPPTAITYEVGVDIVNLVQKELCPIVDALSYPTSTTPGDST